MDTATTKDKSTVLKALLVKDAIVPSGPYEPTMRTAIVTVDGHVSITMDMMGGFEFTLDQWAQVVEFVQAQQQQPNTGSWQPDWNRIDEEFQFVAADENGKVHAYELKPEIDSENSQWWCEQGGDFLRLHRESVPKGIKWTETLQVRPAVSL